MILKKICSKFKKKFKDKPIISLITNEKKINKEIEEKKKNEEKKINKEIEEKENKEEKKNEIVYINTPINILKFLTKIQELIENSICESEPINLNDAKIFYSGSDEKNGLEFLIEIFPDFIKDTKKLIVFIEKSINDLNYDDITLNSHSIKGSSSQFAAKALSQAAFALERSSRSKSDQKIMLEQFEILKKR
jgi:HPt (histidine-containing phosphotransfer) domain-containing protein